MQLHSLQSDSEATGAMAKAAKASVTPLEEVALGPNLVELRRLAATNPSADWMAFRLQAARVHRRK